MKCSPLHGCFFLSLFFGWGSNIFCFYGFFSSFIWFKIIVSLIFCIIQNSFNVTGVLGSNLGWHGNFCSCEPTVTSVVLLKNRFTSITLFAPWKCWPVSQSTTLVQTFMVPSRWIQVTLFVCFYWLFIIASTNQWHSPQNQLYFAFCAMTVTMARFTS